MIGTGLARDPQRRRHERRARHGRPAGLRPGAARADEPLFHAAWERRALALTLAMGATGQWNIDLSARRANRCRRRSTWASSYYEIWIRGLEG
jgi:hypothetical protein